jgi:GT2 family glycosyltransferase
MLLSIIIVNYNVKYFLGKCLSSVEKAIAGIDAEVIVIDNASLDGSLEYLRPLFPWVNFIQNGVNTGFAKANNQGLLLASGKYILFLNPDTIIGENSIGDCLYFMDTTAGAGACGVRMIDGSGKYLPESKRGFPSPLIAFYKISGLASVFPRSKKFAQYYLGHLSEFDIHEIDVLPGAFFLTAKTVIQKTGGFDEAFFMYGEDIDLSYRIQQAGFKNYYFPSATIIHFKGESTKKGSLDYIKFFYQAMSIFVKKHFGKTESRWFSFFIHAAIWLRAVPDAIGIFIKAGNDKKKVKRLNTFILASVPEAEKIKELLEKKEESARTFKVLSKLEDLGKPIALHRIDEMIFSESFLYYKQIIESIQKLPHHISKKFYNPKTGIIIGSDSKNRSGDVIV